MGTALKHTVPDQVTPSYGHSEAQP